MIVQRLSSAIRQQHWFAVLIELLVLVVGIFIGLQVDDWNQQRKERALEQVNLERLATEIADNRDETINRRKNHQRRALTLYEVYWILENGEGEWPAENELQFAFCRWYVLPVTYVSFDIFNELLSTGGLSLVSDDATRTGISASYSIHQSVRQQLEPFQDTMHDLAAALAPYIQWRVVGEYDEESTGAPGLTNSCEIDFEAIGTDAQAMSHLAQLYRTQVSIANFRRLEIQADQTAMDLIAGQRK